MQSQIIIETDAQGSIAVQVLGAAQGSIVICAGMLETAKALFIAKQQAACPAKGQSPIVAAKEMPRANCVGAR